MCGVQTTGRRHVGFDGMPYGFVPVLSSFGTCPRDHALERALCHDYGSRNDPAQKGTNIIKKRSIALLVTVLTLAASSLGVAAKTVKYNGQSVYWNYGRTGDWLDYSFSEVQTSLFEHTATANSVSSGWKAPGVRAYAECYIGWFTTAECYWNCRG